MSENKNDLFAAIKKDLENDLDRLKKENKNKIIKNEEKIKKLENKLKNLYYWLFGVALVLCGIIVGIFFYLRGSLSG